MLLLDDDDELPHSPDEGEATLAAEIGVAGIDAIDASLLEHAQLGWLKVARVVLDALKASGLPPSDDSHIRLHVRRVIGLVNAGSLVAQGNLRKPRWSEVRLTEKP
ncbi:MAG: hypothetical protein ABI627_21595 [Polyangiaceae bacterium]